MKTTTLLLVGAMALVPVLSKATVWRVNNNASLIAGCDSCFQSIATAAADADVDDGDTLHVEASPNSYGVLTLTKRLVLIGPGYKLGSDPTDNDNLQASGVTAMLSLLTLNAGSSGTVIMGLVFIGGGSGVIINAASNITIRRNQFYGANFLIAGPTTNVVFAQNYMEGNIGTPGGAQSITNLMITNNYITGSIGWEAPDVTDGFISNNTFNSGDIHNFQGSVFSNNILGAGSITLNNNTFLNNVASTTQPWNVLVDENVNNEVLANVYVTSGSDDGKWQLQTGPYQTWATDGGQVGMYGGSTPYVLSGIPPIPAIYELSTPATAIQGETINVTLSTRSNN